MKKKIVSLFLILLIVFSSVIVTSIINGREKLSGGVEAKGYKTTIKDKPTDGSTPLDYDSYDNLAIAAGLMTISNFTGITNGTVNASLGFMSYTQNVYNIRTVKDDIAFQQALSTSAFKSVGVQKYVFLDQGKALARNAKKVSGNSATWSTDTPSVYSFKQYESVYGWLPNQISAYILCKETILDISDLIKNSDNTYSIKVTLDPLSAPYNYQKEVMSMGGSNGYPSFSNIHLTFTINSDWQLLRIDTTEEYKISMPGIGVLPCTGNLTEEFKYSNSDLIVYNQDYFESYKNLVPSDGDVQINPNKSGLDYLQEAFGDYITGKKVLSLNANLVLDKKVINAKILIDIPNNVYALTSDDFSFIFDSKNCYISVGNTFNIKVSVDEGTQILSKTLNAKQTKSVDTSSLFNIDQIMDAITNSEIKKDGNNVSMLSNIPLLGINLPVVFNFTEVDNVATIKSINLNSTIIDLDTNIQANIDNSNSFTISNTTYYDFAKKQFVIDESSYLDLSKKLSYVINDITNIINNKTIGIDLNITSNNINVYLYGGLSFNDDLLMNLNLELTYRTLKVTGSVRIKNDMLYIYIGQHVFGVNLSNINANTYQGLSNTSNISLKQIFNTIANIPYDKLLGTITESNGITSWNLGLSAIGLTDTTINVKDNILGFTIYNSNFTCNIYDNYSVKDFDTPSSYYDISGVKDISSTLINILQSKLVRIEFATNLNMLNISISGYMNIDINKNMLESTILIQQNSKTIKQINMIFKDNKFYITLDNNKYYMVDVNSVMNIISSSNSTSVLSLTKSLAYSNNKEVLITNLVNDISLQSLFVDSNSIITNIDLGSLSFDLQILKGYTFDVSTPQVYEEITEDELNNLIDIVNNSVELLSSNSISMNINVNGINIDVLVDSNNNIKATLTLFNDLYTLYYYKNENLFIIKSKSINAYGTLSDLNQISNTLFDSIAPVISGLLGLSNNASMLIDTVSNDNISISKNKLTLDFDSFTLSANVSNTSINANIKYGILNASVLVNKIDNISVEKVDKEGFNVSTIIPYLSIVSEMFKSNIVTFNSSFDVNILGNTINVSSDFMFDVNKTLLVMQTNLVDKYGVYTVTYTLDKYTNKLSFGNNVVDLNDVDLGYIFNKILDLTSKNDNQINIPQLNTYSINFRSNLSDTNLSLIFNNIDLGLVKVENISFNFNTQKILKGVYKEKTITKDNLNTIIDTLSSLIDTLNKPSKFTLDTVVSFSSTKFNLHLDLYMDIKNKTVDLLLTCKTSAGVTHNIYLTLKDDYLYLSYGKLAFKLTLNEVFDLVSYATNKFSNNISGVSNDSSFSIRITDLLNSFVITSDNAKTNFTIDLSYISESLSNFNISIFDQDGINIESNEISYNDFKLSNVTANLQATDKKEVKEQELEYLTYTNIVDIIDYVSYLLDTVSKQSVSLNISGSIIQSDVTYNVSGNLKLQTINNDLRFEANFFMQTNATNYNSHYFTIKYVDQMYYIVYKNSETSENALRLYSTESDLLSLFSTVSDFFNYDFSQTQDSIDNLTGMSIYDALDKIDFSTMLKYIKVEDEKLKICIDKDFMNIGTDINIDLAKNTDGTIKVVSIYNVMLMGYSINIDMTFNDEDVNITAYQDLSNFFDIGSLNPLVTTVFNTAKLKYFHIQGTINVNMEVIGIPIKMNIPVDIMIKMVDGSPYPEILAKIGTIPTLVGVNNDVPYVAGDTGSGNNRMLYVYYKDHVVYLKRTDDVPRFLQKARQYSKILALDENLFMQDPMKYLLKWGIGFSDSIMQSIMDSMNTGEHLIDYTNVLTKYTFNNDYTMYNLTINLKELTNNPNLDTFDLGIYNTSISDVSYLEHVEFNMHMPLATGVTIDLATNDLRLIDIGKELDFTELYNYILAYTYKINTAYQRSYSSNSYAEYTFN